MENDNYVNFVLKGMVEIWGGDVEEIKKTMVQNWISAHSEDLKRWSLGMDDWWENKS